MMKFFKGFALAFNMLSIFPFFKIHDFFKGINGYAVMSYPLVGFILGCMLWGLHAMLMPYFATIHLNIIIFGMWVLLTGALHLDGFCDTIDGLFVPKEKALKVMKDPHIGGMGVIFGVTFLILKASTLSSFDTFYLLPFILMLSRFNASLAIYFYPYISHGMGELAKKEFNLKQLLIISLIVLVFGIWFSSTLLVISLVVLLAVSKLFIKRYNGFNGDMYGFLIEFSELILLNTAMVVIT